MTQFINLLLSNDWEDIDISDRTIKQVKSLYLQIKDIANTYAKNGKIDLPFVYDYEYLVFFVWSNNYPAQELEIYLSDGCVNDDTDYSVSWTLSRQGKDDEEGVCDNEECLLEVIRNYYSL